MSHASIVDPTAAPHPRTSWRLFQSGLAVLAAVIAWTWHTSKHEDPLLFTAGAFILMLGSFPALQWARKGETHFPVFEIFMLTTVPFYAMPLVAGHPEVLAFPAAIIWKAAWTTMLFQLCAIGAFYATRPHPARHPRFTESLLPDRVLRYAQAGIWLNTAFLYVQGFTDAIPYQFSIFFRAAFVGIGTISLFIETRRWGAGLLSPAEKFVISLNVFVQVLFVFRELYLIAGISILLLAMIGYISTSRKLPLAIIVTVLPVLAVLHNGKAAMRLNHWQEKAPLPEFSALPAFFQDWFERGLQPAKSAESSEATSLTGRLFERASLFHMLCVVIERTPEVVPFLDGESYIYVPSQLIPSFLWPTKPSSMLSNVLLAVHYRLIDPENTGSVSIAFGMIAEAYANFALPGATVLGLAFGFAYKRITVAALGAPQFSALGLLTILLAAWSIQSEQILATWLVSLIQASGVVIGGAILFRMLTKKE